MEAQYIDLNDYVHSGEGANGTSYNHRTDPRKMIKMYNANVDPKEVAKELEFAGKVYRTGIPTPKPGEFITDGTGRYGIAFERIPGKVSFSRATSNHPEKVEEYARKFAGMCLKLHSTEVSRTEFPSIKELDLQMLEENPYFTPEEKRRTREFILNAPDATTAIHGDLQYSNALMSDEGDYFIDLGSFAYGHPYFDLGQVMLCCVITPVDFLKEVYHLEPPVAREFWHWFVKGYFGDDASVEEVTKMIEPYSGLMTLLIEKCTGHCPHFHKYLP